MQVRKLLGRSNQEGFAAITIAIVLVLILSLLTVGFAELMRKEERSALDKHLSNQAYYAAESGINDAAKALNAGYAGTKSTCGPLTTAQDASIAADSLRSNLVGTSSDGVSYTCLLIDTAPKTLEYGPNSDTQSKIVEITGATNTDPPTTAIINKLVISWEDPDHTTPATFASNGQSFKPSTGSNSWTSGTGVMRISLTPLVSGGINRDYFKSNTYNAFLYPNGPGATATNVNLYPTYNFSDGIGDKGGVILNGNCNESSKPRFCNAAIDLGAFSQANFLLAMRWIYSPSRVTVSAYDTFGQPLKIKNAQTLVDSTGKAQDVLRRVQVRIPVHNNYDHTDYALETMTSICKQMQVYPDSADRGTCN